MDGEGLRTLGRAAIGRDPIANNHPESCHPNRTRTPAMTAYRHRHRHLERALAASRLASSQTNFRSWPRLVTEIRLHPSHHTSPVTRFSLDGGVWRM